MHWSSIIKNDNDISDEEWGSCKDYVVGKDLDKGEVLVGPCVGKVTHRLQLQYWQKDERVRLQKARLVLSQLYIGDKFRGTSYHEFMTLHTRPFYNKKYVQFM